jgi:hypothetical protein
MRASELIRIKRSRIPLRMPTIDGVRRWERRLERGVWSARTRQFGCFREFRRYLRTPDERAHELGVKEEVLTRFVAATDAPVLTADYVAFGPHRWFVTTCRCAMALGRPKPDLDDAAIETGQLLYSEHIFGLGVFDAYLARNRLGVLDRDIYLMVQRLIGALGAVAAEKERQRRAPSGLHGDKQKQFVQRSASKMRAKLAAGDLRAVEEIYGTVLDLFEAELCNISAELNVRAYQGEDRVYVDHDAMVAIVQTFAARPSPRGPRRKVAALQGMELLREHYRQLTGFERKTVSGDFGAFVRSAFSYFGVAVPGADVGRSRRR